MNPNGFGGFTSNTGFGSFTGFNSNGSQQPTIEELLAVAKMQGGQIGEVAEELTNPHRGILSTIGEGFKNAFGGFVDTISTGSYAVAGILDPNKTISEAIEARETPSDVLLGKKNPNASTLQKTGSFVTRLAVDVILDPVTYVTFGAGSGILGARALTKVAIQDKKLSDILNVSKDILSDEQKMVRVAEQYGIKAETTDTLKTVVSKAKAMTDKEIMVNQAGQEWLNANIKAQAEGLGDISQWSKTQVANLANTIGREKGLQGVALKTFVADIKKSVQTFNTMKAEAKTAGRILEIENKALQEMVDRSIGITMKDEVLKKNATETLGRLLARNPGLMETFFDKGGIKFLGASIVEGARIASAIELIPGMSKLDNVTQPLRKTIGGIFDRTSGLKDVGISTQAIREMEKYSVLADRQRNEIYKKLPSLYRKLNITSEEASLITANLELGVKPSDPTNARMWDLINGNEVLNPAQHELEVLQASRQLQKLNAQALAAKREAGYRVSKTERYVPHLRVEDETKNTTRGNAKLSTTTGSSQFRQGAKYRLLTDKNLTEELIGSPENLGLKPTFKIAEEQIIKENHLKNVEKINSNVEEINSQINTLTERVNDFLHGKLRGKLDDLLSQLPAKDQFTARAFFETAAKYMKPLDVEALATQRAKNTMEAGVKIKQALSGMSEDGLAKLKSSILSGEGGLAGDIDQINELLKTVKPVTKTSANKLGATAEAGEAMAKLREASVLARKEYIESNINKEDLSKFLNEITQHFTENPTGVTRILDQIIGKKQKLGDLAHEMELEKLAFHQTNQDLPALSKYYTDKDGRIFERVTASIAELEKEGFHFEKNSLVIAMKSSMETIRAVNAKYMVDAIAKEAGKPRSMAPDSWVPISIKGLKGETLEFSDWVASRSGEGLVFHPEVAKRVEAFMSSSLKDEATSEVMKKFDAMQNIWKASATSIFPAFHGRNAISNVFQNFLDVGLHALNPANHVASAQIVADGHQLNSLTQKLEMATDDATRKSIQNQIYRLNSKVVFTDASGINWTHGMLNRTLRDSGIAFNPNNTGMVDFAASREKQYEQIKKQTFPIQDKKGLVSRAYDVSSPLSQGFIPYKIGRSVGNVIEDQSRILNFMVNLKNTGDVSLATERTKMFLFDYSNLTEFEKTFMRRIVPFYTWTRKNIELQARTLLSTPGRIAAELHVGKSLSDAFSGGEITEEERKMLPEYLRRSIASGFTFVSSRDGANVKFQSTAQLPVDAAFSMGQLNNLFGSMSPLLRIPIEQATGYSFFRGKQLADITSARTYTHAPQSLKNFIGYIDAKYQKPDGTWTTTPVSLRPERMSLIDQLPLASRPLSMLNSLTNMETDLGEKALYNFFGMNSSQMNLTALEKSQQNALKDQVIKVLKDAKVGREFNKFYLTPQQ